MYPEDRLFLILGSDQYNELSTWKEPRRLPEYAELVVMTRPGSPRKFRSSRVQEFNSSTLQLSNSPTLFKGIVPARVLNVRQIEVSSTEIRNRIRRGLSVRGMVPDRALPLLARIAQLRTKHKGIADETTDEHR
jgi:nicotinate-nucleotide adenylyltransferase